MAAMEAMEAQLDKTQSAEKESIADDVSLAGQLPETLYQEMADTPLTQPKIRDSVTSPVGLGSNKGPGMPSSP